LNRIAERWIFKPLGMGNTQYNPPEILRMNIAPTELDTVYRKRLLQGEVHDENTFLLGGYLDMREFFLLRRILPNMPRC
jgi:CubicO group peptidase (beta-lactamase class C family)